MDSELTSIIESLNENGWCSVRRPRDGENPDSAFIFAVWKSFGEKSLWLYYDWKIGQYFFFVWSARKAVPLAKNKCYDVFKLKTYISDEYGHVMPLAKRVAKILLKNNIYLTTKIPTIQLIEQNYEPFLFLISWFTDGKYDEFNAGLKSDGDKPYFIIGEKETAIRRLKRMGYKTVLTYDEDGYKAAEYVLNGNFSEFPFDWNEISSEIEEYISERIQNDFGDCIFSSNYNNERKEWTYGLELGEDYLGSLKQFVKSWNRTKPFNIKCRLADTYESNYFDVIFKNGFKY